MIGIWTSLWIVLQFTVVMVCARRCLYWAYKGLCMQFGINRGWSRTGTDLVFDFADCYSVIYLAKVMLPLAWLLTFFK